MSVWKQKATAKGGGDGEGFPKAPPGNHPAVLVAIVDLGKQENEFNGEKKVQRRAYFCWELTAEKVQGYDSRNHLVGIDLTVSMNEKAKLRQWVETWRGKKLGDGDEFDITKLLGQKCLLTVAQNKKGYPVVTGVAGVPKGLGVPEALRQPFIFSVDDIPADGKFTLPDWLPFLFGEQLKAHIERRVDDDDEEQDGAGVGAGEEVETEIPF